MLKIKMVFGVIFKVNSNYIKYTQIIMIFFLMAITFGMRVNLPVAILAIDDYYHTSEKKIETYSWHKDGIILSSFFWGYVIPQIGSGYLAKEYGPKWFLLGAMLISSVFTLIIPYMSQFGPEGVIVCRFMQGFSHGSLYPSCNNMLSRWVPPDERMSISSLIYSGIPIGIAISMVITGWICKTNANWPYTFYIYGVIGIIWSALWVILGNSDSQYTGKNPFRSGLHLINKQKTPSVPWKKVLKSLPVWIIIINNCGQMWGFTVLLSNLPTYMVKVLKFDIEMAGVLSAGPYVFSFLLCILCGMTSNYAVSKHFVKTAIARKLSNTIGLYVPAAALLVLGMLSFSDRNITDTSVLIFFLAIGINSTFLSGYHVNYLDICPNHAGTLTGITNGIANMFSISGPLLVQYMVPDQYSAESWSTVFFVTATLYIVCNTCYLLFASFEVQPWDDGMLRTKNSTIVPSISYRIE